MIRYGSLSRAAIVGVVLAVALSGCAGAPTSRENAAAKRLRAGVQGVSASAAAGDFSSAQSALDALEADLLTATAAGDVTGIRSAQIQSAINLVGTDLDAAIEAAKPVVIDTPTPAPAPAPAKDDKPGKDDNKKDGKGKDG